MQNISSKPAIHSIKTVNEKKLMLNANTFHRNLAIVSLTSATENTESRKKISSEAGYT